jgi:hypothetical protein
VDSVNQTDSPQRISTFALTACNLAPSDLRRHSGTLAQGRRLYPEAVEVTFPDGTHVRASALVERDEQCSGRDFGLYMDRRWNPTWPAEIIDWPDLGLPADDARAAAQIRDAFSRAESGQVVEIGCAGGLGRTGTVLACMAVLAGVAATDAVSWVRQNYRVSAIETADQERWISWFAEEGH